jgi:hypothetical protein
MNPPTRLTVATDMSARCDRALARTALLAGPWNAELRMVHVLSRARSACRNEA